MLEEICDNDRAPEVFSDLSRSACYTHNVDAFSGVWEYSLGFFGSPSLSAPVPPIEHFKATGFPQAGIFGTNLLGSTRAGLAMLLLQYHFTQFGPLQPYAGIGASYVLNFGNISDGILTNFSVHQNFGLILQAGADLMLTPNWGVYVDGKKAFLSTDAQGFAITVPVRAHITLDPWRASAGIAFKY